VITLGGLALAAGLVILGARLAAAPAASPDLSRPGTVDAPRPVAVIMRDYVFNPTPLYLVEGETVNFTIVNAGMLPHEFVLGDESVQRVWAAANAAATPAAPLATAPAASVPAGTGGLEVVLRPGESRTFTYAVPRFTALELMCHLPGHVAQGMVGRVIFVTR
jgi:uncharacterized cupredoxin-like copper-binding protein